MLLLAECATKPTAPSDPYADFGNCVEGSEPGYSCSATCAVGWTEVDAPVAECQLGGTWSVTGTCQRVGESLCLVGSTAQGAFYIDQVMHLLCVWLDISESTCPEWPGACECSEQPSVSCPICRCVSVAVLPRMPDSHHSSQPPAALSHRLPRDLRERPCIRHLLQCPVRGLLHWRLWCWLCWLCQCYMLC